MWTEWTEGIQAWLQAATRAIEAVRPQLSKLEAEDAFQRQEEDIVEAYLKVLMSTCCANPCSIERLPLRLSSCEARRFFQVNQLFAEWFLAQPWDFRNHLSSLTMPVLIVHGDRDLIPLTAIQELCQLLPNVSLEILKDCGHFPHIESAELLPILRQFLGNKRSETMQ